jgi:hypothetical protein
MRPGMRGRGAKARPHGRSLSVDAPREARGPAAHRAAVGSRDDGRDGAGGSIQFR